MIDDPPSSLTLYLPSLDRCAVSALVGGVVVAVSAHGHAGDLLGLSFHS